MKCDQSNGYAGWTVCDRVTNEPVAYVVWVDPDDKTFCTIDVPPRVIGNEYAKTTHQCSEITVDFASTTFWVVKAPLQVAQLSPGRQQQQEPSNQPCPECCQPDTCKRIDYCAAHRCGFGETAP
jgi:hypothetical protein